MFTSAALATKNLNENAVSLSTSVIEASFYVKVTEKAILLL